MVRQLKILIACAIGMLAPTVRADVSLISSVSGTSTSATGIQGYAFTVGHEMTVTGLAKYDGNQNGVLDDTVAARIGLWDTDSKELLVSTFIDAESELRNDMFVTPIDSLVVPAGNYTLGVEMFEGQEPRLTSPDFDAPDVTISPLTPFSARGDTFLMPQNSNAELGFGANLLLEQPALTLHEPPTNFIAQRQDYDSGLLTISGTFDSSLVDTVQVRVVPMNGDEPSTWQTIGTDGNQFSGQLEFPVGWHQFEARGTRSARASTAVSAVARNVGIGEVFVIAGQSNAANSGSPRLSAEDERVLTLYPDGTWKPAQDPQPMATKTGGSPWPQFGDLLAEEIDLPVGIVSVARGATRVAEWLPGADGPEAEPLFNRLTNVFEALGPGGARAVLWHQGEQDSYESTSREDYAEQLEMLIDESREAAGYDIPWGVARASYLPTNTEQQNEEVLAAQNDVIANDPLVFAGPNTNELIDDFRRDGIHFNEAGLRAHGALWFDSVVPQLTQPPIEYALGDFNEDQSLDLADFLIFRDYLNETGTDQLTGDMNDDQRTDLFDFVLFRDALLGHTPDGASAMVVPEPAGKSMIVTLVLAGILLRRKRISRASS